MGTVEDVWSRRSDEQLLEAARGISEYTESARDVIRAELRRRDLPEPTAEPAIAPAFVLASPMQRCGAAAIDYGGMLGGPGVVALSGYESFAVMCFLGVAALQTAFLMWRAQTIGKALVGIRIVDEETGNHPGFVRLVLVRALLFNLAYRIPLAGGLLFLIDSSLVFSDQRQTLHDRVASTLVIVSRAAEGGSK